MSEPVFFAPSRQFTVGEIAAICGATLADPSLSGVVVVAAASARDGGPGALIFVDGKRNAPLLAGASAAAVLCQPELAPLAPPGIAVLATAQPALAFARALAAIYPQAARPPAVTREAGISPAAHVDPEAIVEEGATVEAGAVVGRGAAIGRGAIIGPGAVIGPGCQVGRDSHVGASATVAFALIGNRVVIHTGARIGQEGFRFVPAGGRLEKVPQIGRVVIQDEVEIGANTTIDRGGLGDTVIGEGTKIDNLVQIGHNVRIGRCCAIAAHAGISGSVTIGDHVMLGGRVGIADHVTIGDRVQIVASAGVMNDVPAGQKWAGTPAQPATGFFREVTTLRKLAERKGAKGEGS